MIANEDFSLLFDHINYQVLDNDKIILKRSHLKRSISTIKNQKSYYIGIFVPKINGNSHVPQIFYLKNDNTVYTNIVSDDDGNQFGFHEFEFDVTDKGSEFNFNLMFPNVGLSLTEIYKVLNFLQISKVNIFCTYEIQY